jgi:hypothetical protein
VSPLAENVSTSYIRDVKTRGEEEGKPETELLVVLHLKGDGGKGTRASDDSLDVLRCLGTLSTNNVLSLHKLHLPGAIILQSRGWGGGVKDSYGIQMHLLGFQNLFLNFRTQELN